MKLNPMTPDEIRFLRKHGRKIVRLRRSLYGGGVVTEQRRASAFKAVGLAEVVDGRLLEPLATTVGWALTVPRVSPRDHSHMREAWSLLRTCRACKDSFSVWSKKCIARGKRDDSARLLGVMAIPLASAPYRRNLLRLEFQRKRILKERRLHPECQIGLVFRFILTTESRLAIFRRLHGNAHGWAAYDLSATPGATRLDVKDLGRYSSRCTYHKYERRLRIHSVAAYHGRTCVWAFDTESRQVTLPRGYSWSLTNGALVVLVRGGQQVWQVEGFHKFSSHHFLTHITQSAESALLGKAA